MTLGKVAFESVRELLHDLLDPLDSSNGEEGEDCLDGWSAQVEPAAA